MGKGVGLCQTIERMPDSVFYIHLEIRSIVPMSSTSFEIPAALESIHFCCLRNQDHNTAYAINCLHEEGLRRAQQLGKNIRQRKRSDAFVSIIAPEKMAYALAYAAVVAVSCESKPIRGTPYSTYPMKDTVDVVHDQMRAAKNAESFMGRLILRERNANCIVIVGTQEFCCALAKATAKLCNIPDPSDHRIDSEREWGAIDFAFAGRPPYSCIAWEGGFTE